MAKKRDEGRRRGKAESEGPEKAASEPAPKRAPRSAPKPTPGAAPEPAPARSVPLRLGLAILGVGVAAGALGTLLFMSAPGGDPKPPAPKTSAAPWSPPTPPPGFFGTPRPQPGASGPRATGSPAMGSPSPKASPTPLPPNPLEERFPRTVEGTRALALAYATELEARGRMALLVEFASRTGALPNHDPRGLVDVPPDVVDAFFHQALSDPESLLRVQTIGMISNRGFAPAGPLLEDFIAHSTDASARRVAMGGIPEAEGERGLPLLVDLAGRGEDADRLAALEAVAHLGTPEAAAALDKLADSDAPENVKSRARGLAKRIRATRSH